MSYIAEAHSCKKCKNCISKKNKSNKTYYLCKVENDLITNSVYETNECVMFNSK